MKKWFRAVLTFAFAVCLCFGLSACSIADILGFGSSGSGNNGGSASSGNSGGTTGGSGNSGNNSQPKEDSDGTFIYSGASVKAASTSISGDVVIPSEHNGMPIDTIPENAFKGCNGITSVTVPESVTSIGGGAFSGCSSLRSMTLPFVGTQKGNSGSSEALFGYIFGESSYQGGTSTVQYYREGWGESYYIPTTLRIVTITNETVIARAAFENCSMLTAINLNEKVIQVGTSSFENCSKIQEINLPNISIIPLSLFSGCISLSKFTINSSVDTIGGKAFKGCSALSSINSETSGTFVIPNAVTSIGYAAFNGCSLIQSITLPFVGSQRGNSGSSEALFGYIFGESSYQGGTYTVQYYREGWSGKNYIPTILRDVTITNETVIARGAFQNCSMVKSITINSGARNQVGKYAFENTVQPTWN